ncbi:MAG: DUF2029 domain-containing protein [Deltaproteobacteria bacterium]|nr:DUF2029 domain-containing protein [Deltaproteobacteria bacterium]
MSSWLAPETRKRRLLLGFGIYLGCLIVFAILAGDRLKTHTAYNHFAHMADAWLHGREDLRFGPPAYAGGNDFALFEGKWFISFPPFPAVLMLPFVWLSGSPENFRDGQFIVWLAGIGPAVLFLVLEKLRRTGRSPRTESENLQLAILFAFGTVYFFTAVQGTVWFAAHVVGVGLMALFLLCALDAERPWLAGLLLGLMFLTRVTTTLVGVFFVFEAFRVAYTKNGRELPSEGTILDRAQTVIRDADRGVLLGLLGRVAAPAAIAFLWAARLNYVRFHDPRPWAFGHEYLQVGWQARIKRWGLFSFHFLSRNLTVMLTSLPWRPAPAEHAQRPPFHISGHGLALWFTSPFYLWLARPAKTGFLYLAAGVAAFGPLFANLLYQNSGWFQFGYRFSNDYALLLFVMLAVSVKRLGPAFWIAAAWAIGWNLFGAMSFERAPFGAYYWNDPTWVFPPD